MATFNTILDKRAKKNKKGQYNLAIRACIKNDVIYLNLQKLTEDQYHHVFVKKSTDNRSIKFREDCNSFVTKCERVYNDLKPFNKQKFRELVYAKEKSEPRSLLMKELFDGYINNSGLKLRSLSHYKATKSILEKYHPGLSVYEVTPEFLKKFESHKLQIGNSQATIDSYMRNLRRVINYFMNEKKLIPTDYEYPFRKGGYSVKSFFPTKQVIPNEEIISVVNFNEFDNPSQEYSLTIWLLLFYCNGINFVDLLRMKWSNIINESIVFFRKKTETTRKNNKRAIMVAVSPEIKSLIDKIGVKESPFILGKLKEGYAENTFENLRHRMGQKINKDLTVISNKLRLSIPLKMETARDAYPTSLYRNGVTKDKIAEMMGHSNITIIEHYVGAMNIDEIRNINSLLPKKNSR